MQPSHHPSSLRQAVADAHRIVPRLLVGALFPGLAPPAFFFLRLPSHEMRSLQVTPSLLPTGLGCLARDVTISLGFLSISFVVSVPPLYISPCTFFLFCPLSAPSILIPLDGGCQPPRGSIETTHRNHCANEQQPKLREAPVARHASQNGLLPFSAR